MIVRKPAPAPLSAVPNERIPITLILAVALSSYLTWRPSQEIMFTFSDMLFVLALADLALRRTVPLRPFRFLTTFWLSGFVMLVGGLLVGSLGSPDPTRWPIVAVQYLFAWVVLPLIVLRRGPDGTMTMLKASVWGVAAMNLFGAIVYFVWSGTFQEARDLFGLDFLSGDRRLGAFASDANWNGAVLSMAVPAALYLRAKRKVGTIVTLVTLAILLLGVVLTASFTAFVCCLSAIVIFAVIGGLLPRPHVLVAGGVAATLLAIGLYARGVEMPTTFVNRVGNAISSGDISEAGTFEGRMKLMEEAWGVVEHHLLIGVGADQYRVISEYKAPVHNMYLLLWAEGGLVSMLGWVLMVAVLFATAILAYSRDRVATALTLSVAINFAIASTASPHMYARLWAIPVLLALSASLEAARDPSASMRRRRVVRHSEKLALKFGA